MSPTQMELLVELARFSPFLNSLKGAGGWQAVKSQPDHTHHIWGRGKHGDLPSNLVRLNGHIHLEFCHVYPVEGRVAAMWMRSKEEGFSWVELDKAAGGKRTRGWLACHPDLAEPFETMRLELLELPLDEVQQVASHLTREMEGAEEEAICGLCGEPGADKIPHPHYWPGEARPNTGLVHADCEDEACQEAHDALTTEEREATLRSIR